MAPIPAYIPIENNPRLARHTGSMGIVSTDKQGQTQYRIQKERILSDKKLLNDAIIEIHHLKSDIDILKGVVQNYISEKVTV